MAHFAQLDDNNQVIHVSVLNNSVILDEDGNESEAVGIAFCKSLYGPSTRWVQTSYNGSLRGCYAGIGYTYDEQADEFIPPPTPEPLVVSEEPITE